MVFEEACVGQLSQPSVMTAVWNDEQMDSLQGHPAHGINCVAAEVTGKECHTVIDHSLCPAARGPAPSIPEKKPRESQGACGCSKVNDADLVPLCQKSVPELFVVVTKTLGNSCEGEVYIWSQTCMNL